MWIHLFVRNQCSAVPSLGNMCGYRLVFCACCSGSESGGPGYWRGALRFSRCGWDGGRNLSGFSSVMILGGGAVEEACRTEMRRTMAVLEMDCGGLREVVWVDEGRRIERSSRRDIAMVCYAVEVMSNETEVSVDFLKCGWRACKWSWHGLFH
jgi:hypothetical protein